MPGRRHLLAASAALIGLPAWAQFRVEIAGVGASQLPIAIAGWRDESLAGQAISSIIRANLERSGQFKLVDAGTAQLDERASPVWTDWRGRQADALAAGSVSRLADGVIALPGGWGTMEELFEMLTWAQLGLHTRPIGVLNVNGYYEPLKALCALMVQDGFLSETTASILMVADSIEELLDLMANYTPPAAPQWLTDTTT
ncbi:MAG: LOG family protein [Chitinophagaceae bacterium]|nr:LOG family protein [Chitinophagaceae bacterium]